MEACFRGAPFAPHRHDTYAFCLTLGGVQTFDYRGSTRHSSASGVVVLHPDERHDGRAGTDDAFRYRAIYVPPSHLQAVLGGRPLPHLTSGTSTDRRLARAIGALVADLDHPLERMEYEDGLYALATTLARACGAPQRTPTANRGAAERARAFIDAAPQHSITMEDLERAADQDRWQLSRDFRAAFGTSPYRYVVMRRLDRARALLLRGDAGADVAVECGFSDQSHLIRHFRRAYGLTPAQWCALTRRGR